AHFLGASGARRLISMAQSQPSASAASAFPEAARANRSIFYNRNGAAKNAAEVYAGLVAKHDVAPAQPLIPQPGVVQVVNSDRGGSQAISPASLEPAARSAGRNEAPRVRMVEVQLPDLQSPSSTKGLSANDGPIFQSMFRTERSGALSE